MEFLINWWRQPSRYEWLVAYLVSRGVYQPVRLTMIIALLIGPGGPALVVFSPVGPTTGLGFAVTLAAALVGLSTTALWLGHTPARQRTAIGFVIVLTVSMVIAAIGGNAPQVALAGCAYFVMISGYAAVFHSARVLLFVLRMGFAAATILAAEIMCGDPVSITWNPVLTIVETPRTFAHPRTCSNTRVTTASLAEWDGRPVRRAPRVAP